MDCYDDNIDSHFQLDRCDLERSHATSSSSYTIHPSKLSVKTGKKRGPRPKILSHHEKKQKRLDANDRERQRMGQLNTAFNCLRDLLPKHPGCPDRELSKYETVQIAKNYIRSLHATLVEAQNHEQYDSMQNNAQNTVF